MGVAQFRINNTRKWHIRGWDEDTPAHEICSVLMDPALSVSVLAEVLRYFYDTATPGARRIWSIEDWESLTYEQRLARVEAFAGAKDEGELNGGGQLAAVADVAFKLVHEGGYYSD